MGTPAKTALKSQELFTEIAKNIFQDFCKYKLIKTKKGGEMLRPETLNI